MTSKPALSRNVGRLAGWQVLEVAGRDAGAFLQRQTMNDVAALAEPGAWQWNGLLSAKGRVQALFALLRADAETFRLIAPDLPAAHLAELLQRYVLRSKLSLRERSDLCAFGRWGEGTVDCASLQMPGVDAPRCLLLDGAADAGDDPAADARWRFDDLSVGLPRLPPEQHDAWTPQMLALDRLHAFSLKKGCYPGQEIVARTHYLGRAKRRLRRLDGERAIEPGALVLDAAGGEVGKVLCAASWQDRHTALAMLPADDLPDRLQLGDGQALRPCEYAGTWAPG